jgi:signal transduction histidine kinase
MIGLFSAYSSFRRQHQLSEMKSDFVSSVSHELRAPIASVRLMAEGLERGKISEPAKQHEYFKFIVQECRRLSSLIENVLDFSRIEEGRKRYELESTDLVALTQQTVKVMETYAAEREISIALRVTGTAAPVDLDGKAMQQALVNLIDNAIKHSPKGSNIAVGLDFNHSPAPAQPSSVLLSVEDHGDGIAASEQDKIFERFYRIGSELRRETQGVGIGLSIVKHIVEAHGGTVTVRSAPGQGSRFTIELPMGKNGTRTGE